jgi:malonyl CoA-acyl carrier protein transacylase
MLAVTGLELKSLEKKIAEVNGHVKAEGRDETVSVSLYNGAKAFIVTGNPKDLVGLSDALRKNRAPQGKDQSKVSLFSCFRLHFVRVLNADLSTVVSF